jgi:HAD superfamily hydrolase (TIGR01459 family)
MRRIAGLAEVAERFDLYLIDQFGVLHDGIRPYPHAVEALTRLRAAGKRVLLLSNSGKRSAANVARLTGLGFPPALYDILLTSGEAAWQMFRAGHLPGGAPVPARVLVLSRDGDRSMIEGLPIAAVADAREAEAVIIAGSEAPRLTLEDYAAMLAPAAALGLPAWCLNADKVMLTASGPAFSSGRIAELYEAMGGRVTWIGKPFPDIYARALAMAPTPPERVIGIGDSIEHDVAGARNAGFAALLVTDGIHAGASDASIAAACASHGVTPDYMQPLLRW